MFRGAGKDFDLDVTDVIMVMGGGGGFCYWGTGVLVVREGCKT